ncbi:MAG: hypothetical protein ABJH61_01590, partial [Nitratireductor sp.]
MAGAGVGSSSTTALTAAFAAAREAAENAVRSLDTAGIADEDATLLAGDLKTLEGLMRKSDERNS